MVFCRMFVVMIVVWPIYLCKCTKIIIYIIIIGSNFNKKQKQFLIKTKLMYLRASKNRNDDISSEF